MPVVTLTKLNSVSLDTYVSQTSPTGSYSTHGAMNVGYDGNGGYFRSLIKFDLGLIPNDAVVNSAKLRIVSVTTSPIVVAVCRVASTWDANVTWSSQPSFSSNITTKSGTTYGAWAEFDVQSIVSGWVNGTYTNYGFLLKASTENSSAGSTDFRTAENGDNSVVPQLVIDYTIPTTGKKQVEYVGGGAYTNASGTSISLPLPSGTQTGDLLIAHVIGTASATITAPAGWTRQVHVLSSSYRVMVATKFKTDTDTGPFSVTASASAGISGRAYALRNVKSINQITNIAISNSTLFSPPQFTATVDKTLALVLNAIAASSVSFTPPLSYDEKGDTNNSGAFGGNLGFIQRYLHLNRTQTATEMGSMTSGAGYGASVGIALEPITNNPPTVTLTSPADNLSLSEGNGYSIGGTVTDNDNGNVVTIKYKINNSTARALNSGVSNGSTPISFAKTLTYSNKRLWDGSTDVAGVDLAENTNHTLTVWSEDDQGGKSAEVTRTFTVVWNRPPVISGANENLGTIITPPTKNYSITEPESDAFTVTEKINGTVIRTFLGVAAQQEEITIPHDLWISLDLGVSHSLIVEATDSKGLTATRTYTFVRTETHLEFLLNFANPDVQAHFTPDGMPERILITLDRYIPEGADIESVKVTNNNLDATPAWEDATSAVEGGRGYLFTNQTKTAADWQINVWVIIAKGTATERVRLNGFGGAFD